MTGEELNAKLMSTNMELQKLGVELREIKDNKELSAYMLNELDSIEMMIGFARSRLKILRNLP